MSLPGWRTSANQRRRIAEAEQRRLQPPTPERQEAGRVRYREEDGDEHGRNTRRFRWWQENQDNRIQQLVNQLVGSRRAVAAWYWMSTHRDNPSDFLDDDFYFDLEHHMTVNNQQYDFLADALARHWRQNISLDQLRRMQTAYTHEHGFGFHQQQIYPDIPGLRRLGQIDRDMFPTYFTPDGEVWLGGVQERDLDDPTPQDGVNPLRENNRQRRRRVRVRNEEGTRNMTMREYVGYYEVDNPEDYDEYISQENITPDDFRVF